MTLQLVLLICLIHGIHSVKGGTKRPLLACLAVLHWVWLLSLFTGFQFLRLGRQILPILATLMKHTVFIFLTFVFLLVYIQAAYTPLSLGQAHIFEIIFSTYRLGILGHFELGDEDDVLDDVRFQQRYNDEDLEEEPSPEGLWLRATPCPP